MASRGWVQATVFVEPEAPMRRDLHVVNDPFVSVQVGESHHGFTLISHDVESLDRLSAVIAEARESLAFAQAKRRAA